METHGNIGNAGEGNTKLTRVVPGRYWAFTFFYENLTQVETLETEFNNKNIKYFFGFETCPTTEKKHLQGFIQFPKKVRPSECIKCFKTIHYEKCKGSEEQNKIYCSKGGETRTNIKFRKHCKDPMDGIEPKEWQKSILTILGTDPDNRTIHWYWESEGGVGKSTFCKHLMMKYNAKLVSGKGPDIKYALSEINKKEDIDIVLWDIPRVQGNNISYSAAEEIKNGAMFSTKFESGQCLFNPPHVIIFSNFPPEEDNLSKDRWKIFNIKESLENEEEQLIFN